MNETARKVQTSTALQTPRSLKASRHVALFIETSLAFGRGVLKGVAKYMRLHDSWTIYVQERSIGDGLPGWLHDWQGDGIISRVSTQEARNQLEVYLNENPDVAFVDLNEEILSPETTSGVIDKRQYAGLVIHNDNVAIGRMAARHLNERGFKHFGYIGYDDLYWSQGRHKGFEAELKARGFACQLYHWTKSKDSKERWPDWEREIVNIENWLSGLPKPCGIMACNDFRAIQLLDACRKNRIAVPEQVAVIGVDNESIACELARPPLTSVSPDVISIGYRAAEALGDMMDGHMPSWMNEVTVNGKQQPLMIPPQKVEVRESTDIVAIEDPIVAESLYYIRENACKGIVVEDVIEYIGVSRSTLQRRFKELLQKNVLDIITQAKLDKVKQLLIETDLTMTDIAARTGFQHSEYLSNLFKQKVGQTASSYRKEHGG